MSIGPQFFKKNVQLFPRDHISDEAMIIWNAMKAFKEQGHPFGFLIGNGKDKLDPSSVKQQSTF